jgi:hypothetical protein
VLAARNRLVRAYVDKGDAMQEAVRLGSPADFDYQHWQTVTDPLWFPLDEAVANVELFGSGAARDAIRAWAEEVRTSYRMATRPGGAFGAGMREVETEDNQRHRDPFIKLIRQELGVSD